MAYMEVDTVADKLADIVADMGADKKIDINMEIQFGEILGHQGWLIGTKLLRPES